MIVWCRTHGTWKNNFALLSLVSRLYVKEQKRGIFRMEILFYEYVLWFLGIHVIGYKKIYMWPIHFEGSFLANNRALSWSQYLGKPHVWCPISIDSKRMGSFTITLQKKYICIVCFWRREIVEEKNVLIMVLVNCKKTFFESSFHLLYLFFYPNVRLIQQWLVFFCGDENERMMRCHK